MPRANRHFLPGHVWHITHRCHQKKFLLKFARDRRRYLHWDFEAKKRLGLSEREKGVGSLFRFASDDHGISLSIQAQGVSL